MANPLSPVSALAETELRFPEPQRKARLSKEVANASANRDKAIASLGIAVRPEDTDPAAMMRARVAQNRPQRIEQAEQVHGVIPATCVPQIASQSPEGNTS